MSRKSPVISVELEAICHATEDVEKVESALLNFLPPRLRAQFKELVSRRLHTGYHGNPIILLTLKVDDRQAALEVFCRILSDLATGGGVNDAELRSRMDGSGNLYLRFDKQLAYLNKLVLFDGDDVVRVKIKLGLEARRMASSGSVLPGFKVYCDEAQVL